jgi:tetratricopeptide (TPR) repeat protein
MRWILAAALLLAAATARADDTADDETLARAHTTSARSYYEQADYVHALREFDEAYRLSRRPALLYNIAACQERLGRLDEAIGALEQYLRDLPLASDRDSVEQRVKNLRARRGEPAAAQPAATTASPAQPIERPLYRRWWLWTAVGGVVVAGVVIGLAVGLSPAPAGFSPTLPTDGPGRR